MYSNNLFDLLRREINDEEKKEYANSMIGIETTFDHGPDDALDYWQGNWSTICKTDFQGVLLGSYENDGQKVNIACVQPHMYFKETDISEYHGNDCKKLRQEDPFFKKWWDANEEKHTLSRLIELGFVFFVWTRGKNGADYLLNVDRSDY